jgi:hypothetical protein
MSRLSFAIPLLIFLTQAAQARWMKLEEAGSVVENYTIEYNVAKNGSWTQTTDYTVRVLAEDAKTSASLFAIDYNAYTDKVEIVEAYTQNGDKKIPVDPAAIEDRDKGESKDYDALKTRSVVFPQVQIGSRLRIRFTVNTQKPLMEDRWSTEIMLSPGQFVEKLGIKVKSEVPVFYEVSDPRHWLRVKQIDKRTIEMKNTKRLQGWVHGEKEPFFHPAGFTTIFLSTHRDWREFFGPMLKEYAAIQSAPLPADMKSWVTKAAKAKDQREQVLELMGRMSHDFRYFGDWRRHKGGVVPRTLAEIAASRYGDCKDLASLLTAMLRALKIDADVALVRRGENPWGEEPDYRMPSMNHFNHAIVRASVGGQTVWLDATNPVSSLEPYPDIAGRPAWIMNPEKARFERLPAAVSKNYVHHHDYEYRFRSNDLVSVKVDARLGHMAPYHIANQLLTSPRSEVLTDTMEYFSEGQEVRSFHYLTEPESGRRLSDMRLALEYDAGRVTYEAGKSAFFVIPDGFLGGPFYETDGRESDLRLAEEPFEYHGVRRLKDTKLMQARPDPCQIHSNWMDLERRIAVEGKDVVIYQNIDLKQPYVTQAEYRSTAFGKLQKEAKACFYRSGILVEAVNAAL